MVFVLFLLALAVVPATEPLPTNNKSVTTATGLSVDSFLVTEF